MSEHKRDEGEKHDGPQRTSPYPMSRLAPTHDLVDVAKRIAEADAMLGAVASGKLGIIAEQIRALQEEARSVLEATKRDLELHRAQCAFTRRAGQVYHLYRKPNGDLWFSMIGPSEWSGGSSSSFEGSYRLELDQSWTRVDAADDASARPSSPAEVVRRLLGEG